MQLFNKQIFYQDFSSKGQSGWSLRTLISCLGEFLHKVRRNQKMETVLLRALRLLRILLNIAHNVLTPEKKIFIIEIFYFLKRKLEKRYNMMKTKVSRSI